MQANFKLLRIFVLGVVFLMIVRGFFDWGKQSQLTHGSTTPEVSKDLELETALMSLFSRELGYTLIGKKPISIDENDDYYLYKHPHVVKKIVRFLKRTFKNSPRFILKAKFTNDGWYRIEFSNKLALEKLINERPKLLALVKNKFGSTDGFFERANSSKKGIFELPHSHAALRGILLGYGKINADYFCRRYEIGNYLKKYPFTCFFSPANKPKPRFICWRFFKPFKLETPFYPTFKPKEKAEFGSLEDEWRWIQEVGWDLSHECSPEPPYFVELPLYICRHGGDSEQIRENYVKASGQLASLFCNRLFMEVLREEAAKVP